MFAQYSDDFSLLVVGEEVHPLLGIVGIGWRELGPEIEAAAAGEGIEDVGVAAQVGGDELVLVGFGVVDAKQVGARQGEGDEDGAVH